MTRFHAGNFFRGGHAPLGKNQERSGQITSYENRTSLRATNRAPARGGLCRARAPSSDVAMTVIARPFRPDEAAVLRDIRLQALADSPPAFAERYDVALAKGGEDFGAALAAGAVWGVFDDGRCVGMAGLNRFVGANVDHKGYVWGVFVSPAARGTGAAQALFRAVIDHARATGLTVLSLGVGDFNEPAKRLYASFGFAPFGREPRAVRLNGRYIDEVLMALEL